MSTVIDVEPTGTNVATLPTPRGIVEVMASRYGMDRDRFKQTVMKTVIKGNCSDEQFAAFMLVAKEYDLNPFTKEIYAFPAGGGIQPIVSIDGWMKMINSHPNFNGMGFHDQLGDDGKLISITCTIHRKDRDHPISVTEYMSECRGSTSTWKQWPARMLRHKAAIQAARYAFGFSGIMEPDEYERMQEQPVDVTPITAEQRDNLIGLMNEHGIDIAKFCAHFQISHVGEVRAADYPRALAAISKSIAQRKQQAQQQETQRQEGVDA